MPQTEFPELSVALVNAKAGNDQLRMVAAAFGTDYKGLFRCLVRAVGIKTVIAAILSGDFLGALADIDWEAVLNCITGE